MIEFTLPWPPSVNTNWRTVNGRMIISAKGREYREEVVTK
jgi:Holliday junction resolvase RusA-like endonuclease